MPAFVSRSSAYVEDPLNLLLYFETLLSPSHTKKAFINIEAPISAVNTKKTFMDIDDLANV